MTTAGHAARRDLLRVAIVAPALHRLLGGQEVQGDQLSRGWTDDPDVRVHFVESNPSLPSAIRMCEAVPGLRTVLRIPTRAVRLWRALRRVDVVHVFAGADSSFLIGTFPALAAARLLRKPSVLHYHSGRGEGHLSTSRLARRSLSQCTCVVVPSSYLRDAFAGFGVATCVIPNVIDSERFPRRATPPTSYRLVCTRNLEPWYAVDDVVRAFAIIKEALPSAELVLAGRGRAERSLRALVRTLGLEDVHFVGAISRDAMGDLLQSASVMLNASRIDNMPVSILEAFSVGVPVVTTSAGGIRTIARHNETAMVVDIGDVNAMARHALAVLQDRELASRLVRAGWEVADQCAWRAIRPLWHALYGEIARRRRSSAV